MREDEPHAHPLHHWLRRRTLRGVPERLQGLGLVHVGPRSDVDLLLERRRHHGVRGRDRPTDGTGQQVSQTHEGASNGEQRL